jgi:uncharacterized membrane protein YeaQ/YmgE (transglycosylase-associated protein family)
MIIVGLVIGALAKLVMPGRDPGGIIVTTLLGIVGSIIAGSLGGAILLLMLYRGLTGHHGPGPVARAN